MATRVSRSFSIWWLGAKHAPNHHWWESHPILDSRNDLEIRGVFCQCLGAPQNIISKFVYCRNCISDENFKLKLCTCAQSRCINFQLEILTINGIFGIVYSHTIILESSQNVSETPPPPPCPFSYWWLSMVCTNKRRCYTICNKLCGQLRTFSALKRKMGSGRFLSLARGKRELYSANHRPGYWSNLPCDWPSTAWADSKQETENGIRSPHRKNDPEWF